MRRLKYNFTASALVGALMLCPQAYAGPQNEAQLSARYNKCIAKNPAYESQAVSAFWGDVAFMQACAKEGGPIPAPFVIWNEVYPDGRIGKIILDPETPTGKCIEKAVKTRKLPSPPTNDCIIKIELSFKE